MGDENLRPSKDVVSRRVGERDRARQSAVRQMYSLNSTGARAWELLGEGHDPETIETTLSDEYGIDRERLIGSSRRSSTS